MRYILLAQLLTASILGGCNTKPIHPGASPESTAQTQVATSASASADTPPSVQTAASSNPDSPATASKGHLHSEAPPTVTCTLPTKVHLEVPRFAQETQQWCWAAAGQMIMKLLGRDVSQTDQANDRFHTKCQAPTCPEGDFTLSPCDRGSFPAFEDFDYDAYASVKALSLDQIKTELACRHAPIAFSWVTTTSAGTADPAGHMMVAIGYDDDEIEVIDPSPDCFYDDKENPEHVETYSTLEDYAFYVNGAVPENWNHWEDRYAVGLANK